LSAPARARRASGRVLPRPLSAASGAVAAHASEGLEEPPARRALGARRRARLRGVPRCARLAHDATPRTPNAQADPVELPAVDRRGPLSRRRVRLRAGPWGGARARVARGPDRGRGGRGG